MTAPDLFVSCMDNLNTTLRITYHLVGMLEKLEITSVGVVYTRSSQYFDTTDSKQNVFLQAVIRCILQGNTISWHRKQFSCGRTKRFVFRTLATYSDYRLRNPCLECQRRGHHTKDFNLLLVDHNRDILTITKQFTLKSPVQKKQTLRLNEDITLCTDSLNN